MALRESWVAVLGLSAYSLLGFGFFVALLFELVRPELERLDAMVTAFSTGNLFVILPILVENTRQLFEKQKLMNETYWLNLPARSPDQRER